MVVPINWMMISHLCIGNMRTKKSPNFHPLEKTNGLGFQVFPLQAGLQGMALRRSVSAVGSARPRWCHGGWDPRRLRSGGEEVQSGSPHRLFSCSKPTDSARQAITWFSIFGDYIYIFSISRWIVEVKKQIEIRVCSVLDHWKTYFGVWILLICKNQWLTWTQQNQLRKRICCSRKHLFRFLDVFTYQKLEVSISSNWRTWHLIVSFLIGFL